MKYLPSRWWLSQNSSILRMSTNLPNKIVELVLNAAMHFSEKKTFAICIKPTPFVFKFTRNAALFIEKAVTHTIIACVHIQKFEVREVLLHRGVRFEMKEEWLLLLQFFPIWIIRKTDRDSFLNIILASYFVTFLICTFPVHIVLHFVIYN